MGKRRKNWLPSGRTSGWYDEQGYHAGQPPKSVLKKLYPQMYKGD